MRILHMIWTLSGGGAERQLAFIAPALASRGHDVHVAYVYGGVNLEGLRDRACTMHQLSVMTKYDPLLFPRAAALTRRVRPDVVQTWLAYMDIIGGAATRLLRLPWVMSERSAALSYPPTLLHRLRVSGGRRADVIVPNSEGGADYWIAQGVDPARIEIIPNYVPSGEIASAQPLEAAALAADDELVVYVGRLSVEKNLPTLLDAVQLVCRVRPRARLALCGEGPLLESLQAHVRAAGIEERVLFPGFVRNVASWLKRASLFVALSPCEGHPNAVLEAMAAGVPVVVSDIAAHRSILDDGSASFVAPDDVQGIAGRIVDALDHRDAALQRAARARERLGSTSLEATVQCYENVYRRAIAARGAR